jgi:hypothetical protein
VFWFPAKTPRDTLELLLWYKKRGCFGCVKTRAKVVPPKLLLLLSLFLIFNDNTINVNIRQQQHTTTTLLSLMVFVVDTINDDDFGFLKVVAFFENDEFSTRPDESLSQ